MLQPPVMPRCFIGSLQAELIEKQQNQLYRQRFALNGKQNVEIEIDHKKYISFCSNDYLGLARHPAIITAYKEGCELYGAGSGSAHLVTGYHQIHQRLEESLAEFTGFPRVLLFSTGYMANLAIVTSLLEKNESIIEDRLNHASIIDAALLSKASLSRYQHLDMNSLIRQLERCELDSRKLIATDSIFSMDGDLAPIEAIIEQAQQYNAWVMVDDAHGFGVCGKTGRGSLQQQQINTQDVTVYMATFGKAWGTFGAFVAGSHELIETLIQNARSYIYTTAPPAALAYATLKSLEIVEQESWRREHLNLLVKTFRKGAAQLNLPITNSMTAIQPLMIGDSSKAINISQELKNKGFWVTAIRPPTVPKKTARLRITFSANHQLHHVEKLLEALDKVIKI